jgi:thiopurine S-methyltransferase
MSDTLKPEHWLRRWEKGETGWHQAEVEPALVREFGDLAPTRVLVPLCGKSLDLTWLEERGHEVVGIELSPLACEAYFRERGLAPQVTEPGPLRVWRAGRVTLLNGDFFAVTSEQVGPVGAVYDRAALIALPPALRPRYAAHLRELAGPIGGGRPEFLLLAIEREPLDAEGPPFCVTSSEIEALHGRAFTIETRSREQVASRPGRPAQVIESVYRLRAR